MAHKSILITGAASGIGLATAKLFAAKGWLVGVADINEQRAIDVVASLGSNAVAIHVDVTREASVGTMLKTFLQFSDNRLDVMFNCAGLLFMGPHEEIAREKLDLMMDVNIKGVVNCANASFDALRNTPDAHMISMSSLSAEYGAPDHAVYSASKFFVRGFTEALNIEWQRHDINVSAIVVAYVQTPMVNDAEVKAKAVDKLGVNVPPERVAQKVWQAAHSKGCIHRLGIDARAINLVVRLLGHYTRVFYKLLTGY